MNKTSEPSLRLGIIGAGRLGNFHADKCAVHPDVKFVGVFDPYFPVAKQLAEKHSASAFPELESMIENVNAVIIATTSSLHASPGATVLRCGKHLLMEKPLTTTAVAARELIALAEKNSLIFQAGHVEQYNPAWKTARELLAGDRKFFIEARRQSGYTFRCVDIGAVLDIMIHDLELVLSLIESKPTGIEGTGFSRMGGFEDIATATLSFENGAQATFWASRVELEPCRTMKIVTENRTLHLDFQTRTTTQIVPDSEVISGQFSPSRIDSQQSGQLAPHFMKEHFISQQFSGPPVDALALELDNFIDAILRGAPSTVPASRAALAIEWAEKLIEKFKGDIEYYEDCNF